MRYKVLKSKDRHMSPLLGPRCAEPNVDLAVPPPAALVALPRPKVWAVAPEMGGLSVRRAVHAVVRLAGLGQMLHTWTFVKEAGGWVLEPPVLGLEVGNDAQRALHQLVRAL